MATSNDRATEAATALARMAGWEKPETSQFETVMGATELEVAEAHMPPNFSSPVRTKEQLLRRMQLQQGYANAVKNGTLYGHTGVDYAR